MGKQIAHLQDSWFLLGLLAFLLVNQIKKYTKLFTNNKKKVT